MVRFIGIDLAWSLRKTHQANTGGVILDDTGRVIAQQHLTTDDAIVAFVLENLDADGGIVGIDAPLVVPNSSGRRTCEAELQAVGISSYPANRTLFDRTFGGVRGEDLVSRLSEHGFTLRVEVPQGQMQRSIIEVYPRALIRRIWGEIPRYKTTGKSDTLADLAFGVQELQRLMLEQSDPALYWEHPPAHSDAIAVSTPIQLKRLGDLLDAALSAYLAYLAWYGGPERVETIGDISNGFIVLPRSSGTEKMQTLTVRIANQQIVNAIRMLAVEQNRTADDIVDEALRNWLEHQEELEDLEAIAEAEGEPTIPWEQIKEEMRQLRNS
jgi:predicted RNase H-like nuclease